MRKGRGYAIRKGGSMRKNMTARASYSVEAAWIMAISLSILSAAVFLGFDIFSETIRYISQGTDEVDAVQLFRNIDKCAEIWKPVGGK